jgi:hypothetical protein
LSKEISIMGGDEAEFIKEFCVVTFNPNPEASAAAGGL